MEKQSILMNIREEKEKIQNWEEKDKQHGVFGSKTHEVEVVRDLRENPRNGRNHRDTKIQLPCNQSLDSHLY